MAGAGGPSFCCSSAMREEQASGMFRKRCRDSPLRGIHAGSQSLRGPGHAGLGRVTVPRAAEPHEVGPAPRSDGSETKHGASATRKFGGLQLVPVSLLCPPGGGQQCRGTLGTGAGGVLGQLPASQAGGAQHPRPLAFRCPQDLNPDPQTRASVRGWGRTLDSSLSSRGDVPSGYVGRSRSQGAGV